ncbi:MAG: HAD-IA family hydrolase [Candidatus Aenigmatarchaeota archaeon]
MPKFKAVLFDKDGTLIDSIDKYHSSINAALQKFGMQPWSRETFIQRLWGRKFRLNIDSILFDVPKEMMEEIYAEYRKNLPLFDGLERMFPWTMPTLEILKAASLKLAVVTGTDRLVALKILEKFGILRQLDLVVGGDEAEPKPSPEPILKACSELGLNPGEVMYVGDTRVDAEAGKAAGCATAILTTALNAVDLQEIGGILIVDDLSEIISIVI